MPRLLDIAVCGCGPAGLAAALLLHRSGHRVRIFERFETPGPVGAGLILQPTGLQVLAELGVLERVASVGARIDRLFGRVAPSNRMILDVRYERLGRDSHGLAVHRSALFDALYETAVAHGIGIVPATKVVGVFRKSSRAYPVADGDCPLGDFDLVVDALGANSPLANGLARRKVLEYGALWVNVPWPDDAPFSDNALEQRYRYASTMAGVLPIGRRAVGEPATAAFFWSLRRDQLAAWQQRGVAAWKADVDALWPAAAPLLSGISDTEQLTFARYDHFTARRPYSDRLVHVGDAAKATSPQLGQGANMALLDALALARALDTTDELQDALREYARMRYWHVRLFQWASAAFTPFYQSDSRTLAFLRDRITAPLSRLPVGSMITARLVSGLTVPPLGRRRTAPAAPPTVPTSQA